MLFTSALSLCSSLSSDPTLFACVPFLPFSDRWTITDLRRLRTFLNEKGRPLLVFNDQRLCGLLGHDHKNSEDGHIICGDRGIDYVREKNPLQRLRTFVEAAAANGELRRGFGIEDGILRVTLMADKGAAWTKLIVHVWAVVESQSPMNAPLLALYEGPDSREEIEAVCRPIFDAFAANSRIDWELPVPKASPMSRTDATRSGAFLLSFHALLLIFTHIRSHLCSPPSCLQARALVIPLCEEIRAASQRRSNRTVCRVAAGRAHAMPLCTLYNELLARLLHHRPHH